MSYCSPGQPPLCPEAPHAFQITPLLPSLCLPSSLLHISVSRHATSLGHLLPGHVDKIDPSKGRTPPSSCLLQVPTASPRPCISSFSTHRSTMSRTHATASSIPVSDIIQRRGGQSPRPSTYPIAMTPSLVPLRCPPTFFPSTCFLYGKFLSQLPPSFLYFFNLLTDGTPFAGTDKLGVRPSLVNRQCHQLVHTSTPFYPQASYVYVHFLYSRLTHLQSNLFFSFCFFRIPLRGRLSGMSVCGGTASKHIILHGTRDGPGTLLTGRPKMIKTEVSEVCVCDIRGLLGLMIAITTCT